MPSSKKTPLFDRELSWLSFNARVLQEAGDSRVPLLERLKFLAIYSSNLDEFFRVRVASLRGLRRLKSGSKKKLPFNPAKILKRIHRTVIEQQQQFGRIFVNEILPALRSEGIHLHDQGFAGIPTSDSLRETFDAFVLPHLHPQILDSPADTPFLKNRGLYLVAELWPIEDDVAFSVQEPTYGLVNIPSDEAPRFIVIDTPEERNEVVFLDDVVRSFLGVVFPAYEVGSAYSIKMTRDAELYLDEFDGDLVETIAKSLKKRETGAPTRLLFDPRTPYPMVTALKQTFKLEEDDLVIGGVYHNFSDFFGFPDFGRHDLKYEDQPPIPHPAFGGESTIWEAIATEDELVHFPYQSYAPVIEFFEAAASDDLVTDVFATLYRVSDRSRIVEALIHAAENGKNVTVFVEVKARFDEAPNIDWAQRMEQAGVHVLYSRPKIKVHAKIALVIRKEKRPKLYAYLGTGNFNEKTALLYTDFGLFTCDDRLTREVRRVFKRLEDPLSKHRFKHLLVAPRGLRKGLAKLVDGEIEHAKGGRPAGITLKLNNIEDPRMIGRLYEASAAGVDVRLLVRGICRAVPGMEGVSEGMFATSIVDRYLEHARIYRFENGGEPLYYLASADWMRRNLDHRVEVAFPIYDERLKTKLDLILRLQLNDSARARVIDQGQTNPRVDKSDDIRSQQVTYSLLAAESKKG